MKWKSLLFLLCGLSLSFLFTAHVKADTIDNISPNSVVNNSAIGSVNWTDPSFAQYQDSQYATANLKTTARDSQYLLAQGFNFNIPECTQIDYITFDYVVKASGLSVRGQPVLYDNANGFFGSPEDIPFGAWGTSDQTKSFTFYSGSEYSQTLTPNQINSSDFGVALYTTLSGSTNRIAYVNSVVATVTYHIIDCPKVNKYIQHWLTYFVSTVYASTTCSFEATTASTTTAHCDTATSTQDITNTTQDIFAGLILFFIMFFCLLFYFRK